MFRELISGTKYLAVGKFAFAALLVTTFCVAHPGATSYAKKKPKYGTIKILTVPGGFPLEVDGRSFGVTSTEYRSIDLDPGIRRISISLPDGHRWTREINVIAGRIKCLALTYRPAPPPPPPSPCPFPVNVSAPQTVNDGEVITFLADVSYTGISKLNYTWTVSPANARILSGAGTPTLAVDSTGFAGQRISATLVVDDGSGDPVCRQSSQASTFIPLPPPRENPAREFDVCCNCTFDDQKARLDNLAVELQNDPSTTTYIIAYAGRTSRIGEADRLAARARDYLINQRGIDPSRIITRNGGFREDDCVDLWVVPSGAEPPQPRPTVRAGDARPQKEDPYTRRRN